MGGSANQQARVNAAVAEWSHYTSIIFKLVGTAGQIRVAFDPVAGSWSYVGKQNLDADPTKPTMNLAWVDEVSPSPTTSDVEMGIILHEFGHALGFTHESLAPFKGGYTLDPTGMYWRHLYEQYCILTGLALSHHSILRPDAGDVRRRCEGRSLGCLRRRPFELHWGQSLINYAVSWYPVIRSMCSPPQSGISCLLN